MDEIFEVGALEAYIILKHKRPFGKYWTVNGTNITAIDNSRGEVMAEDFDTQEAAIEWLKMDYADKFTIHMTKEAGLIPGNDWGRSECE